MDPWLGYQLERQTILVSGLQHHGSKDKRSAVKTTAILDAYPIHPIVLVHSNSSIAPDIGEGAPIRLLDGLALCMAHPLLVHPTPIVFTRYSPILEATYEL
jgi:hypothetical protein